MGRIGRQAAVARRAGGFAMHIQARAQPAKSAPDLEAYVRVLSEPTQPDPANPTRVAINIEGVTGRELETGGEFVFAFDHDRRADVEAWLVEAGYEAPTFIEEPALFVQELGDNVPGELLRAISSATSLNIDQGRIIRDVLIGQRTDDQRFYVQITFQEVKTGDRLP